MLKSSLRRWLLIAFLAVLSLTVTWAVRAATEPALPISSSSTPATTPTATPAYVTPTGITGPTTPIQDAVAARYNYAFGKDAPFLLSNATSSNGEFLDPVSFPTAPYCGQLPPGSPSPVAPVGPCQRLSRAVVFEKR